MWRMSVTLGGGMTMTYGSRAEAGDAPKMPASSQRVYVADSTAEGSYCGDSVVLVMNGEVNRETTASSRAARVESCAPGEYRDLVPESGSPRWRRRPRPPPHRRPPGGCVRRERHQSARSRRRPGP